MGGDPARLWGQIFLGVFRQLGFEISRHQPQTQVNINHHAPKKIAMKSNSSQKR